MFYIIFPFKCHVYAFSILTFTKLPINSLLPTKLTNLLCFVYPVSNWGFLALNPSTSTSTVSPSKRLFPLAKPSLIYLFNNNNLSLLIIGSTWLVNLAAGVPSRGE